MIAEMLSNAQDMPPNARAWLEMVAGRAASPLALCRGLRVPAVRRPLRRPRRLARRDVLPAGRSAGARRRSDGAAAAAAHVGRQPAAGSESDATERDECRSAFSPWSSHQVPLPELPAACCLLYPCPPMAETQGSSRNRRPPPGRPHVPAAGGVPEAGERQRSRGLRAGGARPRGLLGRVRARARVVHAVDAGARLEAAAREVVCRRHAQRERQLRRSPRARAAPQQGGASSGRASRATAERSPTSISTARSASSRTS